VRTPGQVDIGMQCTNMNMSNGTLHIIRGHGNSAQNAKPQRGGAKKTWIFMQTTMKMERFRYAGNAMMVERTARNE